MTKMKTSGSHNAAVEPPVCAWAKAMAVTLVNSCNAPPAHLSLRMAGLPGMFGLYLGAIGFQSSTAGNTVAPPAARCHPTAESG